MKKTIAKGLISLSTLAVASSAVAQSDFVFDLNSFQITGSGVAVIDGEPSFLAKKLSQDVVSRRSTFLDNCNCDTKEK